MNRNSKKMSIGLSIFIDSAVAMAIAAAIMTILYVLIQSIPLSEESIVLIDIENVEQYQL